MSELQRKTFVFDLDGTICEQTEGGEAYWNARPNPLVVDCVRRLHELGHRIVIHTARGMSSLAAAGKFYGRNELVRAVENTYRNGTWCWLKENGIPFDELIFGKPSGDYYIDDKGMSIGYLIELMGVA
jgi:hydroxymethylpyrimidine pyrophosphatase-like HAD family hydrolase